MRPFALVLLALYLLPAAAHSAPRQADGEATDDDGAGGGSLIAPEMRVEQTSGVRARDGAIRLRLSCPQGAAGSCDSQVKITAGSTTLATGHAEIYNGSAAIVSFGMTKAGKALFKQKAKVGAKVTIVTHDDDGTKATTTETLSIARA